jgi:hypothetical protein
MRWDNAAMQSSPRAVVLLLLLLTSCAHAGWVTERLYCGRSIPDGGMVSDEEWTRFVAEVVTPRFPDGLTIWRADGQWREGTEIIREPVMVIEVLHAGDPASRAKIEQIAQEYRTRFRQSAVLRVTVPARATFL